jgi:hypothetical protein
MFFSCNFVSETFTQAHVVDFFSLLLEKVKFNSNILVSLCFLLLLGAHK